MIVVYERGIGMKEWVVSLGVFAYIEAGIFFIGIISLLMTISTYRKLIKEAELMGTSNHSLIKYIRLKVGSYYKIGMEPENTEALVEHYLYKYKVGFLSLGGCMRVIHLMSVLSLVAGIIQSLYSYGQGKSLYYVFSVMTLGIVVSLILLGIAYFCNNDEKKKYLKADILDYVDNYLKNRLIEEKGDVVPQNRESYKRALQEAVAAAPGGTRRSGRTRPFYDDEMEYSASLRRKSSDEIDAKVVEDVLKEFLN